MMLVSWSAKNSLLILEFVVMNYRKGQSIAEAELHVDRLRFLDPRLNTGIRTVLQ